MNKKMTGSFLVLTFVLSILSSAVASAFGEMENTQYQTEEYDWFKGIFGNLFSLAPSGCIDKYETTYSGVRFTKEQFPITARCPTGYNIGSPVGSYYCKIAVVAWRNDLGYTWSYSDPQLEIKPGESKVINWYNYYPFSGVGGPYNIGWTSYQMQYYSWSCPTTTPVCTPADTKSPSCASTTQGTYQKCKTDGSGWVTQTVTCDTGTECKVLGTGITCPPKSCAPNWQWGIWDVCKSNNQQTRTGADGCGNTQTQTQACTYTEPPPSCAPVWNPGSWGSCINGQQTRTVTTDTCGKTTTETQGCSMPATCTEGAKQLNSCPDGTTYDYKICRNNNWEVIPYATSPCQKASNCPMFVPPKECGQNEKSVIVKAGYVDSNGCNIAAETKCEPIAPTLDGSTTAILAIGGLSALLVGLLWFIRKKK